MNYLTYKDISKLTGYKVSYLRKLASQGEFKTIRLTHKKTVVEHSEYKRWINQKWGL